MAKVNVLVLAATTSFGAGIGEENFKKIQSVSPVLNVVDGLPLIDEDLAGDLSHKAQLDIMLKDAEILFARRLPENWSKRTPNLKWIQMMYTGMERVMDSEMLGSRAVLTNASGIEAVAISEWVITMLMAINKHLPHFLKLKEQKKWEPEDIALAKSQTLGILGLGSIGTEVAKRAKALGMKVIATRRSVKKESRSRYADRLLPASQMPVLLKESDFVAITLPLTSETAGLIGERELRMMKPSAHIINIGRGPIIDEQALIRALEEKRIAGAALDVFANEPLPPESKLWELPNVICYPHNSGRIEDNTERVVDLFCENLKHYLAGKRLLNVVNKKRGY